MFVIDNIDDFNKYFNGSYIAVAEKEGMQPCYIRSATGEQVELKKWGSNRYSLVPFKDVLDKYKLTVPRLGAISTEHGFIYLALNPYRQWIKGFTPNRVTQTIFASFDNDDAPDKYVYYVYNPTFYDPSEILKLIAKGKRVGGAISHKCGIFVKAGYEKPLVTYKEKIIGQIEDKNVLVLKMHEGYLEYVRKIMPEFGFDIWNVT